MSMMSGVGGWVPPVDPFASRTPTPVTGVQSPLVMRLPEPGDPILLQQPKVLKSLSRKITGIYPQLAATDPTTANALYELDQMRVARGQSPMSDRQTVSAFQAATPTADQPYGRTMQPVKERGTGLLSLPGNAIADLRDIFTSVPKLPFLAYQTVRDIPKIPSLLNEALQSGDLRNLQNVPVLNLVPGVYTATNVLSGHADEALKHPLFTGLDVLPMAKAKVFRAPASMLDEAGNLIERNPTVGRPERFKVSPYDAEAAIGKRAPDGRPLVSVTDLAANTRVGRAAGGVKASVGEVARNSRVGEFVESRLGSNVRDVSIHMNVNNRIASDAMRPDGMLWGSEFRNTVLGGVLNEDQPAIRALHELETKYNDEFGKQHYGSAEEWAKRRSEIADIVEGIPLKNDAMQPVQTLDSLTDVEREFVNDYRGVTNKIIEPYVTDSVERPNIYLRVQFELPNGEIQPEILPFATGKRYVDALGRVTSMNELQDLHRIVTDPNVAKTITPEQLAARIQMSPTLNGRFTKAVKSSVMEGYVHAAFAAGIDADAFLSNARKFAYEPVDAAFISTIDDLRNALPWPPLSADELRASMRDVRQMAGGGTRRTAVYEPLRTLDALMDELAAGKARPLKVRDEFLRVHNKVVGDPAAPEAFRALDPDRVVKSLEFMNRNRKWLSSDAVKGATSVHGERLYRQALRTAERAATPARYVPHLEYIVRRRMTDLAAELSDSTILPEARAQKLVTLVSQGQYTALDDLAGTPGLAKKTYSEIMRDIPEMWRGLAADGFDPQFVPHVKIGGGGKAIYPKVTLNGKIPTHFEARTFDFRPREGDMALALHHQLAEIVVKKLEDRMVRTFVEGSPQEGIRPLVRPKAELLTELEPVIDRAMAANPTQSRQVIADNIIGKTWVAFDVNKYSSHLGTEFRKTGGRVSYAKQLGAARAMDQLMIPKAVADMLEQAAKPQSVHMVWDPVMNVFRASALLLSPRWQVYNVLGNALTVSMSEGFNWLKHLPSAYKAVRAIREGAELPANIADIPYNVRLTLARGAEEQLSYQLAGREGVHQLRDLVARHAPDAVAAAEKWGKPLSKGMNRMLDFSVRMNAMVDDAVRIAGYLSAVEKAGARITPEVMRWLQNDGLYQTRQGAMQADGILARNQMAETAVRRWSYNWDAMTPWERSVARQVFPFYGFFSHILRYAGRYTMDHPFRVAVTAAFARNELKDWGTGLPQRVHNMVVLGNADEKGNRFALNFAGWNPFADTADLFTPTGWMSQVNPLISTLAEQFGIDPRTGEASLYPTAEYDPKTGRLALKKRGIIQSAVQNIVPQSQVLFNLTGQNPDFNELARTNRGAATRLIASAAGLPVLARPLNIPQEVAKTEMVQENAARQALSEALKYGDTAPVASYPSLSNQVQTLLTQRRMMPQLFAQYTPTDRAPGTFDLVSGALQPWKAA